MVKKRAAKKKTVAKARKATRPSAPAGYVKVLADLKQLIAESRRRALASVNRELVLLYWQIGAVIVRQQEQAKWGDGVVEQLATDLRAAFPDMKGVTRENLFRARKAVASSREVDRWLQSGEIVATLSPPSKSLPPSSEIVATLSPQFESPGLAELVVSISWSHHKEIVGACETPAERYFYMQMTVRELRRQINSDLFTRYVSVKRDPEKCLPAEAESGDLLPFKDDCIGNPTGQSEWVNPVPTFVRRLAATFNPIRTTPSRVPTPQRRASRPPMHIAAASTGLDSPLNRFPNATGPSASVRFAPQRLPAKVPTALARCAVRRRFGGPGPERLPAPVSASGLRR